MTRNLAIDAAASAVALLPDNGLGDVRAAALKLLQQKQLPGPKDEDWKYTDLAEIIQVSNDWLNAGAGATSVHDDAVNAITADLQIDWLVVRNGHVDVDALSNIDQPGLHIEPLSKNSSFRTSDSALSSLNAALLREGISVEVDASAHCKRPVGLLFVDDAVGTPGSSHTRVVITLGANSSARFVEYHASSGDAPHYANNIIDLRLEHGANAEFVRIQERGELHSQTEYLRARLETDSHFVHSAYDFGGQLTRNDLHVEITGPGASAEFNGLYLATDGQHIDNHTRVDHCVGPASSAQEYRGILHGQSRCIWNGKAIVHAGADGTDANQANHNLLLTERCEIDAKPELEIYADDVKCSHGTTVGQLDETALFYLRTRGIDDATARQLLTRAFAEKVVALAPIAELRDRIGDRVSKKLAQMSVGAEV